jgi:hypothetical protein
VDDESRSSKRARHDSDDYDKNQHRGHGIHRQEWDDRSGGVSDYGDRGDRGHRPHQYNQLQQFGGRGGGFDDHGHGGRNLGSGHSRMGVFEGPPPPPPSGRGGRGFRGGRDGWDRGGPPPRGGGFRGRGRGRSGGRGRY